MTDFEKLNQERKRRLEKMKNKYKMTLSGMIALGQDYGSYPPNDTIEIEVEADTPEEACLEAFSKFDHSIFPSKYSLVDDKGNDFSKQTRQQFFDYENYKRSPKRDFEEIQKKKNLKESKKETKKETNMKKKYTKKQITEAIAFWEKQLKKINESLSYGNNENVKNVIKDLYEIVPKLGNGQFGEAVADFEHAATHSNASDEELVNSMWSVISTFAAILAQPEITLYHKQ